MYGLRAGTVLTTLGPRADVNHPLARRHHRFVDLGRATGLPPAFVAFGGQGLHAERALPDADYEARLTRGTVTSSEAGTEAALTRFPDLDQDGVWEIGSPRIDLLLRDEAALSTELRRELAAVRGLLDGRRLVLLSPSTGSELDLAAFAAWARERQSDVVVAVLSTSGALPRVPSPLVDLMDTRFLETMLELRVPPVAEMVWRLADVLVSGTPADLADFAPLGRPAVPAPGTSGLPFEVPRDTAALLAAVEQARPDADHLAWGRELHMLSDGHSAARFVRRLKQTYLPWDEWLSEPESSVIDA